MSAEAEKIRHCLNCIYVYEQAMLDNAGKPVIGQRVHLCKRFPPSPVLVPMQNGLQMISAFPPVSKDVSCHEHTFEQEIDESEKYGDLPQQFDLNG